MSKKSSYLAMAMMGAMMSHGNFKTQEREIEKTERGPIKRIIPKGCSEFHFDNLGSQVYKEYSDIHYSCIASSLKVALRKLNKFNEKNIEEKK